MVVPADEPGIRKLYLQVDPEAVEWYDFAVQGDLFWFRRGEVVDNKCPVL